MSRKPERWFLQVRVTVSGLKPVHVARSCLIGPLASWTAARKLGDAWEREFGAGTVRVRAGAPGQFRHAFAGGLEIVGASAPLEGGGWGTRPLRVAG